MDRLLRSRSFVASAAFVILLLIGLVIGYVTGGGEEAASFPAAAPVKQSFVRGTVQSINGNEFTLSTDAGAKSLTLAANAPVETLRPVEASTIAKGDWVNGGAVRNAQTVFALTQLVLIRQAQLGAASK